MDDLTKYRKKISKIDIKMKKLFLKRMEVVDSVKEYKKKHNLPIYDKDREDKMKINYTKDLNKDKESYLEFLDDILKISKDKMNK